MHEDGPIVIYALEDLKEPLVVALLLPLYAIVRFEYLPDWIVSVAARELLFLGLGLREWGFKLARQATELLPALIVAFVDHFLLLTR